MMGEAAVQGNVGFTPSPVAGASGRFASSSSTHLPWNLFISRGTTMSNLMDKSFTPDPASSLTAQTVFSLSIYSLLHSYVVLYLLAGGSGYSMFASAPVLFPGNGPQIQVWCENIIIIGSHV